MMFVLSFILPSFTFIQDDPEKDKMIQKTSDSLVVKVKFQNPEITVTDSRTTQDLEKKFDLQTMSNEALLEELRVFNKNVSTTLESLSERRCESEMDRIKRITGYTEAQVLKIFKQERTTNTLQVFTLMFLVIAVLIIYNTSFRRLKELVAVSIFIAMVVGTGIICILEFLLPKLYGVEYQMFFQLIEHIPK